MGPFLRVLSALRANILISHDLHDPSSTDMLRRDYILLSRGSFDEDAVVREDKPGAGDSTFSSFLFFYFFSIEREKRQRGTGWKGPPAIRSRTRGLPMSGLCLNRTEGALIPF